MAPPGSSPDRDPAPDAAARLAEMRASAQGRIAQMDDDMVGLVDASRGSNADDEHDPEGQTIAYERAQLASLTGQAHAALAEIDAATARLAAGTYGRCEVCQEPIGDGRLGARPTARACIRHAGRRRS
ncbi:MULTISPECIES: TraR/DksA family transcriptional regulator [unclassified Ornithinimicrobium]|uniref:TraR/DksA family transcriptional regulator n=1 Tax=unclassified Ornithinimicrobium TaxID=2615080 RepID=UPI0038547C28